MANEEHLSIIKRGVEPWNAWRERNSVLQPDLKWVELNEVDLSGINLAGADLREAKLMGTDLSGANLRRANLVGAHLNWANLKNADLVGANLAGADFWGANLVKTDLSESFLKGAVLSHAAVDGLILTKAQIGATTFGNLDLSTTIGLAHVIGEGLSTLGFDTLIQSKGELPDVFLGNCGLSNSQIQTLKNLSIQTEYHSCFLSFNSEDEQFAQKLHDSLQENGIRCWFAPKDIRGGQTIYQQIYEAIGLHEKLIIVLSERSLHNNWVAQELKLAHKREKLSGKQALFPIRLVDNKVFQKWELFDIDTVTDLAAEVRQYFIPDFSGWEDPAKYQVAFERLLRDLKVGSK